MSVNIPQKKLQDTHHLVEEWGIRKSANIHQLQAPLGKLLHLAQCCPATRRFLSHMLATLIDCPDKGTISLTTEFRKDQVVATKCPKLSFIREDIRQPINIFVDANMSDCGALCQFKV